jgi:hypothetical protein
MLDNNRCRVYYSVSGVEAFGKESLMNKYRVSYSRSNGDHYVTIVTATHHTAPDFSDALYAKDKEYAHIGFVEWIGSTNAPR